MAVLLTHLTRKSTKFVWRVIKSFQGLKNKLTLALVLAVPSGTKRYVIYSDASKLGLKCVLMQNGRVIS